MTLSQLMKGLPSEFEYHSLQKEIRDIDKETLHSSSIISHETQLKNFEDTAALLETLDLIVTVCTSIAHLSGAMAKPTWVLLPFVADWRWMLDRNDSPWYPTMTLYRQPAADDWDSVMSEIRLSLARHFAVESS